MSAQVISFGIQKGGSSKTATSGVTAHLLSRSHKVLTIDMDSQGNLTEFLARKDIARLIEEDIRKGSRGDMTKIVNALFEEYYRSQGRIK